MWGSPGPGEQRPESHRGNVLDVMSLGWAPVHGTKQRSVVVPLEESCPLPQCHHRGNVIKPELEFLPPLKEGLFLNHPI